MKDPITGREISDECWNGFHRDAKDREGWPIGCKIYTCRCGCHEQLAKHRVKRGPKSDQTLMEVYGTIQIGEDKPAKWKDE